jgi:hypothetical protein
MKPRAYNEDAGQIELIQTHISFVFLIKSFAYKVKKAVDFGFVDFTTLEKRRFFCEKEFQLNKRLCEDLYLEVVPINKSDGIKIKGDGETVEYAVKMRRISQERMLSKLFERNEVDKELVDRIAKIIADFHSKAETSAQISRFGSLAMIETNWKENFDQTEEFVGKTVTKEDFEAVSESVREFMAHKYAVFEKRRAQGRIRDCHGDIHSGNIFVADKIYIFDAIEFNDRFRYSDVASDIAFLAMDLDFKERADLSEFLTQKYIEYSGDQGVRGLMVFYKCYRAYVRGKVISFKLNDKSISKKEKNAATKEAAAYFELSSCYAKNL